MTLGLRHVRTERLSAKSSRTNHLDSDNLLGFIVRPAAVCQLDECSGRDYALTLSRQHQSYLYRASPREYRRYRDLTGVVWKSALGKNKVTW
jgi:hypothetical protein